MIAEIYRKVASQREDQLTGDVFGALRYIDPNLGLIPLLSSSYFLEGSERKQPLYLSGSEIKEIRFWPWLVEAEPDVLIELVDGNKKDTVIVIEVKYYSGLSSDDRQYIQDKEESLQNKEKLDELLEEQLIKSRNQLIRQMRGMKKKYLAWRKIIIFLTCDVVFPKEILYKVREIALREQLGEAELYWLSWHDVPGILTETMEENHQRVLERERIIIQDLTNLLETKGFGRLQHIDVPPCPIFKGFTSNKWHVPGILQGPQPFQSIFTNVLMHFSFLKGDFK